MANIEFTGAGAAEAFKLLALDAHGKEVYENARLLAKNNTTPESAVPFYLIEGHEFSEKTTGTLVFFGKIHTLVKKLLKGFAKVSGIAGEVYAVKDGSLITLHVTPFSGSKLGKNLDKAGKALKQLIPANKLALVLAEEKADPEEAPKKPTGEEQGKADIAALEAIIAQIDKAATLEELKALGEKAKPLFAKYSSKA